MALNVACLLFCQPKLSAVNICQMFLLVNEKYGVLFNFVWLKKRNKKMCRMCRKFVIVFWFLIFYSSTASCVTAGSFQ